MTGNTTEFRLDAVAPFRLSSVALSHGWVQLPPFGYDRDSGTLTYVSQIEDGSVVGWQAVEVGEGMDRGVSVTVDTALTAEQQAGLAGQVTWMLGLDQDLGAFHAMAQGEPKLAHVVAGARGRILRSSTLFEDVVKTILTTNTSWAGTIRMVSALVDRYGAPHPTDGTQRAFPTAARLADVDDEALRSAGLGYRAPFVAGLARAVGGGEIDLAALRDESLGTSEIRRRLLAIKGVGAYAAASLLMLLGHYDFVPVDSWAKTMVSREWHNGDPVGKAEVEAAFEDWGAWQGLAYWFWSWDNT